MLVALTGFVDIYHDLRSIAHVWTVKFAVVLSPLLQWRSGTLWSSLCTRQQVHGHYCSFQPKIPLAIFPCECHCRVLQCDGHGPVKVFARRCCCHIVRSINSTTRATLSAIECEIPTTAALVTGSNAKVTSEIDIENRLCIILHELTALP